MWPAAAALCAVLFGAGLLYREVGPVYGGDQGPVPADTLALQEPTVELRVGEEALALARLRPEIVDVTDAAEGDGVWALVDGRAGRIHVLFQGGRTISFGRLGEGPGELRGGPSRILVAGDELVLADWLGSRLDRFALDGRWLGRTLLTASECSGAPVWDLLLGGGGRVLVLRWCPHPDGSVAAHVEEVDSGGGVRALIHVIYANLGGQVDPFRNPLLAVRTRDLLLGIATERCLTRLDPDGDPQGVLCYPEVQPPLLPDSVVQDIRAMASQRPQLRIDLPERHPTFRAVAADGDAVVLLRDLEDGIVAVERLTPEGPSLRLLLPAGSDAHLGARSVLLHREELEGTRLAIVPLEGG